MRGRYAGLMQILGLDTELLKRAKSTVLPTAVDGVDFGDHKGACSLVEMKTRHVLYREIIEPPMTKPHPQQ